MILEAKKQPVSETRDQLETAFLRYCVDDIADTVAKVRGDAAAALLATQQQEKDKQAELLATQQQAQAKQTAAVTNTEDAQPSAMETDISQQQTVTPSQQIVTPPQQTVTPPQQTDVASGSATATTATAAVIDAVTQVLVFKGLSSPRLPSGMPYWTNSVARF